MFRLWLTVVALLGTLAAADPAEEAMSPLEMLMFKIGFTALVDEFEQEKNTTAENRKRIEELEKNFQLLVKFMEMTKHELVAQSDVPALQKGSGYGIYNIAEMKKELSSILTSYKKEIEADKAGEIARLKREVVSLKEDIRMLVSRQGYRNKVSEPVADETKKEPKSAEQLFRLVVDELAVKKKATPVSESIAQLKRGDRVVFESCDRYGWCRLTTGGYVPRHLFLPAQ